MVVGRIIAAASAAFIVLGSTPSRALVVRDAEGKIAHGCGVAEHGADGFALSKAASSFGRRDAQDTLASPFGMFAFHYDTLGTHAVPMADADPKNGVPDWIDVAAWIADSVLTAYGELGYHDVLRDNNGAGGSMRYDIYCSNLGNVYGYTWSGQNGFLEIDNDFAESNYEAQGYDALRVTLAHELFHAVQFTYNAAFPAWWMEITATSMEEVMYDQVNDYYQYLNPSYWSVPVVFERPDAGISYFPTGADVYPYSAAVFIVYLLERFGEAAITAVRATFEAGASDDAAVVHLLEQQLGHPIENLLAEFWVWSYFTGPRARAGQFFAEAANYKPAPLDTTDYEYETTPYKTAADRATVRNLSSINTATGLPTVGHLGAHLLRIVPDGSPGGFRVNLNPSAGGQTRMAWAWLLAVAWPETVYVIEPTVLNATTGESQFVVGSNYWQGAQDIVLVGANGETFGNSIAFSFHITYDASLDIAESPALPSRIVLGQNAPNPFNPSTTIPLTLDRSLTVSLVIYDAAGRLVRTLVDQVSLEAGGHRFLWDGMTDRGQRAGAGVYVVELRTPSARYARRMVVLR